MAGAEALVMTKIHTVMIALLCGSACVDDEALASGERTLSDDARAIIISDMNLGAEPDLCELLPTCGICSVACDPDALAEHVPPGTCAAFVCELTDGRQVSFHACHPHE